MKSVVVVEVLEVPPRRSPGPDGPCDVRAAVLVEAQIRDVVRLGDRFGVSLAGVVDDQHLDRFVRLGADALDGRCEPVVPVVGRDDDRHERGGTRHRNRPSETRPDTSVPAPYRASPRL
ncbi:hypothetical protein BN903_119 [Halorubrum sp. AJ67]|nr:hypothetical protein BN903_119 [Halorubrum sp. AJ67]